MIYLTQILGNPVYDKNGEKIGKVNDLGIATGEVFPRVTALAVEGPGKTPFMISWRKYVESFDEDVVHLKVVATDIRFSYLQPDEVLIARDLLNKQIVDTRGMRVVRVNDLKLSDTSSTQLRLLGAEVGVRGLLRALSPKLEHMVVKIAKSFGKTIPERIIAWNYMDLLDRDLSNVKLSVSHKTLDDMHPADIADIIEKLDPRLRGQVFAQLDDEQAANTMAEFDDDDMAAELMGGMDETSASRMLSEMDPDDAAELVSELDYEKAEKLLRLMGVKEQKAIRQLLGYKESTAGRIMTSEVVAMPQDATKDEAVAALRGLDEDFETVHYVYLNDEDEHLCGVVTLKNLLLAEGNTKLADLSTVEELIFASPEDDQEDVAENIAKYNLLAMPVVDDNRKLLGIVTVDDALDVLEEEHEEDLHIAGASTSDNDGNRRMEGLVWLVRSEAWFVVWMCASALLAAVTLPLVGVSSVLAFCIGLPVAIIAGADCANYVTTSYIEDNNDEKNAPSVLGFSLKAWGLGLVFAALVWLIFGSVINLFIAGSPEGQQALVAVSSAAICILVSFLTAPLYYRVLKQREAKNLETSGTAITACFMAISTLLYLGLILGYAGVFGA